MIVLNQDIAILDFVFGIQFEQSVIGQVQNTPFWRVRITEHIDGRCFSAANAGVTQYVLARQCQMYELLLFA